ncbi:unnamed protein product, partial [Pocillopora meandrina]
TESRKTPLEFNLGSVAQTLSVGLEFSLDIFIAFQFLCNQNGSSRCTGSVFASSGVHHTIFHIDQVKAEVRLPCGMVKDWFPSGTKPQNSQPPYLLHITDPDGRSVYNNLYMDKPHYGPGQRTYTITLNGTRSGNMTQNFTGFMLYAYNEFDDEDSGDFLSPLPAGVSKRECLFNDTGQFIEALENSTNSMYWHSIQIKWRLPKESISGKITISASVVKEDGIFWDGISGTSVILVAPTVSLETNMDVLFANVQVSMDCKNHPGR